ncbi:peptidoglycan/xylan/chitin deacetylase (PgdA/CDA1 family) [Lysinibacillus parviboronicapiens]|uniref:Peptidoglycan/xylan/chitin deacetylase (PgdA/CDA1 family) n=2 Tax=Lysinibacillus parviboronicapiens TaxID=436516 RepID=A0ABV2PEY4_9BACI
MSLYSFRIYLYGLYFEKGTNIMQCVRKVFFYMAALFFFVAISDQALAAKSTNFYEYSNAKGVTVINYHSFGDYKEIANINITAKLFREQLQMLKDSGYTTITEAQLIAYLQGHGRIPEKSVFLTIDDGYESVYTIAYPILKEMGMQATLFVIVNDVETGLRKGVPMLNWQQIKEMSDSSIIQIGNHTYDLHWRGKNDAPKHEAMILNQTKEGKSLTNDERRRYILEDVTKAHQLIEKHTGKAPTSFAYPYGVYDRVAEQAIKAAGYQIDYSTQGGFNMFGDGTVHIKRIDSSNRVSAQDLKRILEKYQKQAEQHYKNRDIQVEAQVTADKVALKAWLKSDMKNSTLQAQETRFELYKMVKGERQLQRNFGSYLVKASNNTRVMSTEENVTNYEAGGYSVKIIMLKQNGSKEVFWINFNR